LLDSLKDLSFDDILAVLQLIVDMLQNLDGSSDGSPLADVFDFEIPIIDRTIGDLVDLSGDFIDFVDDLVANPAGSLQSLETRLRSLLGLPPIVVPSDSILSFDTAGKILNFEFGFSSGANITRPFNLDLADANLGIFSQLVGLSASGNLGVDATLDQISSSASISKARTRRSSSTSTRRASARTQARSATTSSSRRPSARLAYSSSVARRASRAPSMSTSWTPAQAIRMTGWF
jgi:hypothetical protein